MSVIDIKGEKALEVLLRKYTNDENELEEIKADILSKPSGELIYFVCRQSAPYSFPYSSHKQQAYRVYHN